MRIVLGALVVLLGIVSIAMTARYGWKQADNHIDQAMAALMYGTIALCAIIFDGVAIRLWIAGWRKVGGFIGAVAALAFIVTFSNSLGSIASRHDSVEASRQTATESRDDNRRELGRLEKTLAELGAYVPTDAAAVKAAQTAADAATESRKAECEKRGNNCRDRERDERDANLRLERAAAAKATTDRARDLERQIGTVRGKLGETTGIGAVNPLAKALSNIIPGLGEGITSQMQAIIALVFELCIVAMMVGFEALGHVSKPAARSENGSEPAPEVAAMPPALRPADMSPKPAPVLARPKPKLAATNRQPIGAVLDFLAEGVEITEGPRTELADAFIGYRAWCGASGLRPMTVGDFVDEMEKACRQFGIRMQTDGDRHYLLDLRLARHSATASEEISR